MDIDHPAFLIPEQGGDGAVLGVGETDIAAVADADQGKFFLPLTETDRLCLLTTRRGSSLIFPGAAQPALPSSIDGNHGIALVLVSNERKEHIGNQLDLRDKSR